MAVGLNAVSFNQGLIKITVDGGAAIEKTVAPNANIETNFNIPLLIGFASSIKVEMRGAAAVTARYWAVSLVE